MSLISENIYLSIISTYLINAFIIKNVVFLYITDDINILLFLLIYREICRPSLSAQADVKVKFTDPVTVAIPTLIRMTGTASA